MTATMMTTTNSIIINEKRRDERIGGNDKMIK
jgi:hypothetical protein